MYKKTLKHQNRNAKLIMWLLFVCGIFLFFFAGNGKLPYPSVAQTISVIMICIAVYIAVSFVLKALTVEVFFPSGALSDSNIKPEFAVFEQRGMKNVKVCQISLSDVSLIEKITPQNKDAYKQHSKGAQRYKYNTVFLQAEFIHILTRDNLSILVTYDESLFVELSKYL